MYCFKCLQVYIPVTNPVLSFYCERTNNLPKENGKIYMVPLYIYIYFVSHCYHVQDCFCGILLSSMHSYKIMLVLSGHM